MWLHREAAWWALIGMLIPMVESHCSCCLDPAGASQKEPHSRVQAVQHYLQSMEESWKNGFSAKKNKKFFSSTQVTKIKSAWFFFLQSFMWNSKQLLPFKGVWGMLGNLQELTINGWTGCSKALDSHVLWLLQELPPCNPVPFLWMATPHH